MRLNTLISEVSRKNKKWKAKTKIRITLQLISKVHCFYIVSFIVLIFEIPYCPYSVKYVSIKLKVINKCMNSWVLSLLLILRVEFTSVYFMLCVYTQKISFWLIFGDFHIHQKKFRVNLYRPPNWKIIFTYVLDF